ncbi:hypothetical protein [Anaeromyxobacter diazotrophicus]|uniref:Uncharacterized protein n=1 Tax=Anaeromyxobacter diazotrophicus TaxID=2590199 RepID=A0A7I9VSW2_9BACT|nr:hypothetical protein [Anaeromyxobacter diazotrophicus]GEJ59308.1 hypothetical protein AMYX_40490 [Anaeromyxobacter diazotrophicus]
MAAEGLGAMDPQQIAEAVSAVKDQVLEAVQQASERLEVERRMRENPWLVLGVAAGAGFLLGGGLWPALRPVVKAATRTALSPSNLVAVIAALGAFKAAQGAASEVENEQEPTPTAH